MRDGGAVEVVGRGQSLARSWKVRQQALLIAGCGSGERWESRKCIDLRPALPTTEHLALGRETMVPPCLQVRKWRLKEK